MPELLRQLLIVCPLVFLAGFIDSIAGGGGLITLPAYLLVNIPVHFAAGTNKVVNGTGALISSIKYFRTGNIYLRVVLWSAMGALAGAAIGAKVALFIPEGLLEPLILIALPLIAVFLLLKKDFGQTKAQKEMPPVREHIIAFAIGLGMGLYDGIVGPGTGTFLIMLLTMFLNMDLITAAGSARMTNLASNIAAATVFIIEGKVLWAIAVPAAVCSALGNYCGTQYAVRGGSKKVRGMIFVVLGMLFVKVILDLF